MNDIKLKPRSSFWLTRFLNRFGAGSMWMTFKDTIYYPDAIEDPYMFPEFIEHEKVHIKQYEKYGTFLFLFLYLLFPLPIFFAYFRWKFEREAYLVQAKMYIEEKRATPEYISESISKSLWNHYFFTWPRALMKKWLLKQLNN